MNNYVELHAGYVELHGDCIDLHAGCIELHGACIELHGACIELDEFANSHGQVILTRMSPMVDFATHQTRLTDAEQAIVTVETRFWRDR